MSKLRLESSVKASMLMVRQESPSVALVCCWIMDILDRLSSFALLPDVDGSSEVVMSKLE